MARKTTQGPPDDSRTGEDEEEGWEDFERKRDWFLENRDVQGEQSRTQLRLAAIAQVDRSRLAPSPVWGRKMRAGFDVVGEATAKRARRTDVDGMLAAPVAIDPVNGDDVLLRIRPAPADLEGVATSTVRMFRRDPEETRWRLVAESGWDEEGRFAWSRVRRPGVYAPFGLADVREPRDLVAEILGETGRSTAPGGDGTGSSAEGSDAADDDPPLRQLAFEFARFLDLRPATELDAAAGRALRRAEIGWWKLGPRNINGRVKSLAIHPTNRNLLLAGAANGGVWRTTDGGATWNARWFGELSMAVGAIAFAPSSPSRVYAATGEDTPGWGPSYGGVGVYRSTNGGWSWALCDAGPGPRSNKVLVHPTQPDTVYVASNDGLWKSTTGGIGVGNWVRKKTGHLTDALLDPDFPETLYVAEWNTGLFKSTDGGDSWAECNGTAGGASVLLPTGDAAQWPKLAMGWRGNHKTKYLLTKLGTDSGKLFYSVNGGTSWLRIPGIHQPASYNEWTNMVSVHPTHSKKMLAGAVGMSRTVNRFTWNPTTGTHSDHHQVVYDPVDPNIVYVATDGGVYRSDNGGRDWVLRSFGMAATQLYSIGVSQTRPLVVGAGTQDQGIIGLRSGSELDWFDYHAGNEGGFFVVDPSSSSTLYCCPWSHDLRRSTDGGATWTDIRGGMIAKHDGEDTPLAAVSHLAVRPDNPRSLIAGGRIVKKNADGDVVFTKNSIYRSLDQGDTWMSRKITDGSVTRVAFAPSDGRRSYAATNTGFFYRAKKTTYEWIQAHTTPNKPSDETITGIGVSWTNPDRVYVSLGGFSATRVARSEDAGSHWVDASGGAGAALPAIPINSLAVDARDDDVVYAATDIGVFRSLDAGASWQDFNDGWAWQDVPRVVVTELVFRRTGSALYASTVGRGAYRRRV
ncbi:MAG: hypothetical protein ABWY55_06235 [Microbacterium sp.]